MFDLGGTLMEYVGMPYSWVDFYAKGLEFIIQRFQCRVPQEAVETSLKMINEFNTRLRGR